MSIVLAILALLCLAAAAVLTLVTRSARAAHSRRAAHLNEEHPWTRAKAPGSYLIPALLAAASVGLLALSCVSIVPTKQVGIPVTFGKPGTPVENGLHFKAPWTEMVKMDGTIQSLDATGENATIAKDVDKADVMVHNNVRWEIKPEAADSLYRDYREFENVNDSLVQPALRTAVADTMSDYNPLGEQNLGNAEIAEEIKTKLQEKVGERITVREVSVTLLDFSQATKDRINALNTERGNTRIAQQRQETATAEAQANKILSESVAKDPNVLVSRCLDLISEGHDVPAGFQCWPGQSDTAGVIVDGSKKAEQPQG